MEKWLIEGAPRRVDVLQNERHFVNFERVAILLQLQSAMVRNAVLGLSLSQVVKRELAWSRPRRYLAHIWHAHALTRSRIVVSWRPSLSCHAMSNKLAILSDCLCGCACTQLRGVCRCRV